METFHLIERRPSECRLPSEDAAFLVERHGAHLQLLPARQAGVYRIRPTRLVGVLTTPHCRFIIRPKLPLRSFAFLLDPDNLPEQRSSARDFQRDEFGLLDYL